MTARCEVCGTAFPEGSRSDKRYCSVRCITRARDALYAAQKREARKGRHCLRCGDPISPDRHKLAKYCTDACQSSASTAREDQRAIHAHVCKQCGIEFRSRRRKQTFCSPACQRAAKRKPLLPRPCEHCGTVFQPKVHREKGRNRFCGQTCASRWSVQFCPSHQKKRARAKPAEPG